jgi:L-amino acid N-acyltransferase YncA
MTGVTTSIWSATFPSWPSTTTRSWPAPPCISSTAAGRHIGRVSVPVHPDHRSEGLARALVTELIGLARYAGLEHVEAEFAGKQEGATRAFALMGFTQVLRLEKYVKDMDAKDHDYILMSLKLTTDEEYAGMG